MSVSCGVTKKKMKKKLDEILFLWYSRYTSEKGLIFLSVSKDGQGYW